MTGPQTYEVDPDGDTVIVLKPTIAFAVWQASIFDVYKALEQLSAKKNDWIKTEETRASAASVPVKSTSLFGNGSASFQLGGRGQNDQKQVSEGLASLNHRKPTGPTQTSQNHSEDGTVRFIVSSRHLTRASVRFRTMMTGEKWKEGIRGSDGMFHTRAEGWDAEAFLIVMRVIHLQNRQVPKAVSLELMTKIAVIVDFYEFEEAVEGWTDRWLALLLRSPVPQRYCRDVVLWICIARIFGLRNEYRASTEVVIRHATGNINTMELPIWVADHIDKLRCQAIAGIVSRLQALAEKYQDPKYSCPSDPTNSFFCGAFLLGGLIKEIRSIGLILSPYPTPPYGGFSFELLRAKLCDIRATKSWTPPPTRRLFAPTSAPHGSCDLRTTLSQVADEVNKNVVGLELAQKHTRIPLR